MFHQKFSELVSAFSLWPNKLVQSTIISTNTSTKNYSKSLRGVPISFSFLKYGMFACSTTLISRFSRLVSKQETLDSLHNISVFLIFPKAQWFFHNCSLLTYIILCFLLQSELQNYSLCESLIKSSQMKQQKVENRQQKHQNYDLQKYLV